MSTKKATKRALLTSILAICLCLVMLIGSTFAWFTDTASTSVNSIQSGNLDVDIEMKDSNGAWVTAVGQTLSFRNKNDSTDILWEPGASFNLDSFRIVNKGNLALKYTVTISGITGDAKLLEAIDFTVKKGENADPVALEGWNGVLLPKGAAVDETSADKDITDVETSSVITINGKMRETAGNEYMNKTLKGIAITVNATQYTYEYDSTGNQYDANATMLATDAMIEDVKTNYTADATTVPAGFVVNNDTRTITISDAESFLYYGLVFDREAAQAAWKTANPGQGEYTSPYYTNYYEYNGGYMKVYITCDIDFGNMTIENGFNTAYAIYGNGHTMKNLIISGSVNEDVGFFKKSNMEINGFKFEKITVNGAVSTGNSTCGIVAGSNSKLITNCTVKNCSVSNGKYTGAIVGYAYCHITNCIVEECTVSGQYKVGGLTGFVPQDTNELNVTGNTLTNVTIEAAENKIDGKDAIMGKLIGQWYSPTGNVSNNTFETVTGAENMIGSIAEGSTVNP